MALDQRSLRLFEACSCKPASEGLPPSLEQHRARFLTILRVPGTPSPTVSTELAKRQKRLARSRLRAARCVESAPMPMKKDLDHYSTDSAEIEALITRLERGQLRDGDAQSLARLLRLLLRLMLQQKNASLSRLKRLLFGPRSDTRMKTNPSPAIGTERESDSASFIHELASIRLYISSAISLAYHSPTFVPLVW